MHQPPPFARPLDTNGVLTEREAADLKLFLKAHQSAIDDLDREAQVLVDRRLAHERAIKQYSPLLAPIRRVPLDILLSIFEYACLKGLTRAKYWEPQEAPISSGCPSPVVLSHVCREWRCLSLGHPLLWSEIRIPSHQKPLLQDLEVHLATLEDFKIDLAEYEERMCRMRERCLAYISRSDPVPLTITFCGVDAYESIDWEKPPDFAESIVDILCGVSKRWKRVSFIIWISKQNSPLFRILELKTDDFPLLEEVDLNASINIATPDFLPNEAIPPVAKPIELFKARCLRSLRVNRSPYGLLNYRTDVTWETVTELHLSNYAGSYQGFEPQHAIEVLRSFPQLIHCSIMIWPGSRSPWESDPIRLNERTSPFQPLSAHPISLPHLKSLAIRQYLPPGLAASLHLPSLRQLSLRWSQQIAQGVETSELVDWVRRFGSQLTEFTFHYRNLTERALLYTLENLPALEMLRMVGSRQPFGRFLTLGRGWQEPEEGMINPDPAVLSDSILEKLTSGGMESGGSPLCPNLRRLYLWPWALEFTEKALVKLIAARRRKGCAPPRDLNLLRSPTGSSTTSVSGSTPIVRLEYAFVAFVSRREGNVQKVLEEDSTVDLEGFTLVVKNHHYQARDDAYETGLALMPEEYESLPDREL